MLSENEQKSMLPVYLNNYFEDGGDDNDNNFNDNDNNFNDNNFNDNDFDNGSSHTATTVATNADCRLPEFVLLYLLWDCRRKSGDDDASASADDAAESFRRGPFSKALRRLTSLAETRDAETSASKPSVYVVVDMLVSSTHRSTDANDASHATNTDDDGRRKERFGGHQKIAEALARKMILPLEDTGDDNEDAEAEKHKTLRLSGATVGLADHPRAAPGLESCLEAITVGAGDRRRHGHKRPGKASGKNAAGDDNDNSDNSASEDAIQIGKSCVGIACASLRDLIGVDASGETDAVQGLMQSHTHAVSVPSERGGDGKGSIAAMAIAPSTKTPPSPILEYAHGAHRHWRVHKAGLAPEPTPGERVASESGSAGADSVVGVILTATAIGLIAMLWTKQQQQREDEL